MPRLPGETDLERISRTGELRVGYLRDNAPFSYRNQDGSLVGLEIDLAYRLAVELDADLLMVPVDRDSLDSAFAADHFDIVVGGQASLVPDRGSYRESEPYLDLNAALVMPDYRADDFATLSKIRQMDRVRIGYVEGGVLVRTGRHRIPRIELVAIPSAESYLDDAESDLDALLTTAESGAIHSMTHPAYSVVVPEGLRVRVPLVVAVAPDEELARTVNRFLRIKRADGTVEALHDHWILGVPPTSAGRRWSVAKDVLGWGD